MDQTMNTDAGYQAHEDGKLPSANPHAVGTRGHDDWDYGFYLAHRHAQE